MRLERQSHLSGKGLLYIPKLIPPDNAFARKTPKWMLTIEDSQKRTLKNVEWGSPPRWDKDRTLSRAVMTVKFLCQVIFNKLIPFIVISSFKFFFPYQVSLEPDCGFFWLNAVFEYSGLSCICVCAVYLESSL